MPGPEEDLALPKATVAKLIKAVLPPNMRCAPETAALVLSCCEEFVHLIASEANEQCTRSHKKTIVPEHVFAALKALGFEQYVSELSTVYDMHKVSHEEKQRVLKKPAANEEEIRREQEMLFAQMTGAMGAPAAPSDGAS